MGRSLGANFHRLCAASGFSNLADGVFQIALPLLALQITRSPAEVAGVSLAGRLPWLLFTLHAGALADRLDRRRTMFNVNLARVVLLGVLGGLVAGDAVGLPLLYAVAFVLGAGETLFDTSAQSIMPAVVDRDDLSRANGRLYAVELTMNQFVGPVAGGVLAAAALAAAFVSSAACYAVAAGALALLTGSFRPERSGPPTRLGADVKEGVRYLARHRLLRTLALMTGVMNLGAIAAFAVLPLYAVDPGPMGLSEAGFGVLFTASAVGSVAGTLATHRLERWLGRARLLLVNVAAGAAVALVPALTASPVLVALAFAFGGLTGISWNVVTVSLRQRIVPDQLLGRVNAGYRLLAWGTMPLGAALGGLLGEVAGIRSVFVFNAVTTALLLLFHTIVTDDAIAGAEHEVGVTAH